MQKRLDMDIKQITDRKEIQKFLLQDPYLHIYEMGDLQDKLFGNITWHAAVESNVIKALAMVYLTHEPILFLLEDKNPKAAGLLLERILDKLPGKIYCHLSKGLSGIIEKKYALNRQGNFFKMKLTGDILVDPSIKYSEYTYRMNVNDFETVNAFLKRVNPKAFFVHGMLDTKKYFCIRKNNEIICMAGVHLYSKEYSVAAVGNIVTDEKYRGKGFAKSVTASLCRDMWDEVKYIGLNVKTDNTPAIKAYERIGFTIHSECEELRAAKI
jgi:ribosomal protein S18 acetylase RimI-like enzyme